MTPITDPAPFAELLRRKRRALLDQIALQRGGLDSRAAAAAAHREVESDDRATALAEHELEYALAEHELAELADIDAALARIAAGDYGLCVACGAEIGAARLQALPEAARCIACQQNVERQRV
jgi:DnaK suppressor protein